jgi:hypothetical protein
VQHSLKAARADCSVNQHHRTLYLLSSIPGFAFNLSCSLSSSSSFHPVTKPTASDVVDRTWKRSLILYKEF